MSDETDSFQIPAAQSAATAPEVEALERDLASLRSTITWVLAGLLLLSIAVNAFMWRQVRIVRTQLQEERNHIARYQQVEPNIAEFVRRLQGFAAAHPDFMPILLKYGLGKPASGTNAPARTNAPAGK